jgi:hypothetical protein
MLARVPVTSESSDQEPARWDERDWEDLLDDVADHSIIPIVGSELLTVEFEGGTFPLYRVLAEKLAQRLRLPTKSLSEGRTLIGIRRRLQVNQTRLSSL